MVQQSATSRWAVKTYGPMALLTLAVFLAACEEPSSNDAVNDPRVTVSARAAAKPLFIVDGKKLPLSSSKVDPLSHLNPSDIESIDVLKGEKAISKYGDEGKNGVILVTTKNKSVMKSPKPFSTRLRFCQRRLDNQLIAYTFGPKPSAFVTPFFKTSTLKQRILMLQKSETSRWAVVQYGLASLLIASLFVFIAACEDQSKQEVASQEPITISGQILANDGKPIPGANIVVQGASSGTTTDAAGNYQLAGVPANGTLLVSFVGHKSVEIPVSGVTTINARLALASEGAKSTFSGGTAKPGESGYHVGISSANAGKVEVFTVVENNPEFPGGMDGLTQFMTNNIRYPEAAKRALVSGKVFVSFVINTDGSFQDIQILKGMGFGTDEEAIRVIKSMPRWKPGTQNGQPVRVRYNLPINFQLTDKITKSNFSKLEDDGEMEPAFYEEVRREYNRFLVNGKSVSFEEYVKLDKYAYQGGFDKENKTVSISVKMPIER